MNERKEKSSSLYISLILLIGLIGAAISFSIIYKNQKTDLVTEQINEVKIEDNKESKSYDVRDFLSAYNDVFLESYYGPSDIIELNDNEIENLAKIFENHDISYLVTSNNKEISYLYSIHIKNEKIKIKLNESYLLFENPDEILLYTVENEGLKDLIAELQDVYMVKYNNQDIFHLANNIKIYSKDEGKEWDLSPEEIDNLETQIYLKSPMGENEVVGIPRRYPDYVIIIKTDDKDYSINLVSENILSIDSGDSITYYEYNSPLWEYINKTYSVDSNHSTKEFQYLLGASKVVVNDLNDNFDIEDESFYNIEIPRYIISANKRFIEKPKKEKLLFTMIFTVDKQEHKVEIYENQIIFAEKTYFSERIGEAILSMLNV